MPQAATELAEARALRGNGSPASIAAERTISAGDFAAPASQTLLEKTYLAGLRKTGVPEE